MKIVPPPGHKTSRQGDSKKIHTRNRKNKNCEGFDKGGISEDKKFQLGGVMGVAFAGTKTAMKRGKSGTNLLNFALGKKTQNQQLREGKKSAPTFKDRAEGLDQE